MISLENVTIKRGAKAIFENLSFKIMSGEHWVISGGNGSGKTLLLELLAGSVHIPKGVVHYDFISGDTWDARNAEKKQKIHYIPAHAIQNLIPGNSNLYYQQRYYADADNDVSKVRDLLNTDESNLARLELPASLAIDHLLSLELTRLSNGQLRKILLVKSLLGAIPKVLLLDYPFEGLDSESRKDLSTLIDHIAMRYKIQIIMTDHHHQLPSVINRRLVLRERKVDRIDHVLPSSHTAAVSLPSAISDNLDKHVQPEIIRLKNLSIRYGDKTILNNFNWTVRRGERWAVIGKNGSGKTTLFSMIFADHPMAYTQEIYLFGRRRGTGESIWDIKKRISYLGPEIISFLNPKSIAIPAREFVIRQLSLSERVDFEECLRFFEADDVFDQPVRHLSSGQLQLMEIVRSLSMRKELVLLDEPFQYLDPDMQARVRRYLHRVLQPETTLILITHYEQDISEWTGGRITLGSI